MNVSEFKCPFCLDVCDQAMEVGCCGVIFCEKCIQPLRSQACPHCRADNVQYHPNLTVRRQIRDRRVACPNDGCESTDQTVATMIEHLRICPRKVYTCPAPGCQFSGMKRALLEHVASGPHADKLAENVDRVFRVDTDKDDPRLMRINELGRGARPGPNGKYHCGVYVECNCCPKKKQNCNCSCCWSQCGFTDGCNCNACQKLDIQLRKLPAGWLVNNEGSPTKKTQMYKPYYCGRRKFDHVKKRMNSHIIDNGPQQEDAADDSVEDVSDAPDAHETEPPKIYGQTAAGFGRPARASLFGQKPVVRQKVVAACEEAAQPKTPPEGFSPAYLDPYCGPETGPSCGSCMLMEKITDAGRYKFTSSSE